MRSCETSPTSRSPAGIRRSTASTRTARSSARSPGAHHNWGRFGEHDQIGTANLLTPERVAAAAALVRTGKRFSLALPIGPPTPGGYRAEPLHLYRFAAGDGVLGGGRGGASTRCPTTTS